MAQYQNHLNFSTFCSFAYVALGLIVFDIRAEYTLVAFGIFIIAGLLPNIDDAKGNAARELASILAFLAPVLLVKYSPWIQHGGTVRIAWTGGAAYVLTRVFILRMLQRYTSHRGVVHSLPALIIAAEITYLLFWDVPLVDRLYLAGATGLGFLSHLLLDAAGNLDLVGKSLGRGEKKVPALSIAGNTWYSTFLTYLLLVVLGVFVMRDFYHFKFYGGLNLKDVENISSDKDKEATSDSSSNSVDDAPAEPTN